MSYTHANDSIPKSVILYTPYTKISVSPGASIDYSIDLINNTDQLTNANLSVSGLSASWKHEMKSGGWSLSQLSVLPKEKKTFNLKVEVPLKVNKGNYHFVVYAGNATSLPDQSSTDERQSPSTPPRALPMCIGPVGLADTNSTITFSGFFVWVRP